MIKSIDSHSMPSCSCTRESNSITAKIRSVYISVIKELKNFLFNHGWIKTSNIVAALLSEPLTAILSGLKKGKWEKELAAYGFIDGAKLDKFIPTPNLRPVLLLHGSMSTPDIWLNWAPLFKKARDENKIGQVIVLQLPEEIADRIALIKTVVAELNRLNGTQVDLIGHSKGGFAAHLAAFEEVKIFDEAGVERRWHSENRNPLVNKVVTIGSPTWLCMENQTDSLCPKNKDIYPQKGFTKDQEELIQSHHPEIFELLGTEDTICQGESKLANGFYQVFRHGHLDLMTCLNVCEKAISILVKKECIP